MPGYQRFLKTQVADSDLNRVQDKIKTSIDSLDTPLNNGRLIKSVSLPAIVNHGLGRSYVSWFVGRLSANANVWEAASPDPTKFIALNASAPVVVDLLVI